MSGDKKKVDWIYNFNKEPTLVELRNRNINYDENLNLDQLRRLLIEHVKSEDYKADVHEEKQLSSNEKSDSTRDKTDDNKAEVYEEKSLSSNENLNLTGDAETENSDSNSDMSSDTPKLEFYLHKQDWETFADRLEIFFVSKSIADDKKASIALTRFDESAYKLIKSLCAPKKPIELTYEELKKYMQDHLNPAPSEAPSSSIRSSIQLHPNPAPQEKTESIAEFAARLKKLALNCNFKAQLMTALRDQFI